MEGNSPAGRGVVDRQGAMNLPQHLPASLLQPLNQPHPPGSTIRPQLHNPLPLSTIPLKDCAPQLPIVNADRGKASATDEDDPNLSREDGGGDHHEGGIERSCSPWHRVKWSNAMVRFLVNVVYYATESAEFDIEERRKFAVLQKKGKWRLISKLMAERGFYASPQQCEDKFNDLNKRYKRLTEILGRGTSCKVVENPALLDLMDHISDKAKDVVRKILSSKQLFYEEMCSYHNGNRVNLPVDRELERSLHLALGGKDGHDMIRAPHEDANEEDHGADAYDLDDDFEENKALHRGFGSASFPKRMKLGADNEHMGFASCSVSQENDRRAQRQGISVDSNQVFPEGSNSYLAKNKLLKSQILEAEEKRLRLQARMLEIEKQRWQWLRFCQKKDKELDQMRLENEQMNLENEHLLFDLKRKELELSLKLATVNHS